MIAFPSLSDEDRKALVERLRLIRRNVEYTTAAWAEMGHLIADLEPPPPLTAERKLELIRGAVTQYCSGPRMTMGEFFKIVHDISMERTVHD
jgi:hypothetical protein